MPGALLTSSHARVAPECGRRESVRSLLGFDPLDDRWIAGAPWLHASEDERAAVGTSVDPSAAIAEAVRARHGEHVSEEHAQIMHLLRMTAEEPRHFLSKMRETGMPEGALLTNPMLGPFYRCAQFLAADHSHATVRSLTTEAVTLLRGATFSNIPLPQAVDRQRNVRDISADEITSYLNSKFERAFTWEAVCATLKEAMLDFEAGLGKVDEPPHRTMPFTHPPTATAAAPSATRSGLSPVIVGIEEDATAAAASSVSAAAKKANKNRKKRDKAKLRKAADASGVALEGTAADVQQSAEQSMAAVSLADASSNIGRPQVPASSNGGDATTSPPEELVCPLTHELMVDPVMTDDGQTYERAPLERWLASHDTDPLTGMHLKDKTLRPNVLVRGLCRKYAERVDAVMS